MPRALNAQIKSLGEWVDVSIGLAVEMYSKRDLRCPECHGKVIAHRDGHNGQGAHFEHKDGHAGCSLGNSFGGNRSRHPRALA